MEIRINPITNKTEIKVQPEGRPAIWIEIGYCERCEPYGECMGLMELTDREWEAAKALIKEVEKTEVSRELTNAGYSVKKCALYRHKLIR
jgi:hypothetical protein